jgi:hypothetical protein
MSAEIPTHNPEKKEVLDDNARKFIVETIDPTLLVETRASSYTLTTDWLETGEDNEKKLAHKKFDNGDIQILLIAKVTKDGNRTSEKTKITEDEYKRLLESSVLHLEKKRHEFTYAQNGVSFSMKYDEFADSELRILEVDAASDEMRDSFIPEDFPAELIEVTGDTQYYGYRVADVQ